MKVKHRNHKTKGLFNSFSDWLSLDYLMNMLSYTGKLVAEEALKIAIQTYSNRSKLSLLKKALKKLEELKCDHY